MAVPARITLITLGVADLRRATAFYRALGWEPTPYSTAEITFIQTSDSMLALFPTEALAADVRLDPPTHGGFRGVTLAIVKPAEPSQFFDGLDGYFTDPDGHAWEVAHNPDLPGG